MSSRRFLPYPARSPLALAVATALGLAACDAASLASDPEPTSTGGATNPGVGADDAGPSVATPDAAPPHPSDDAAAGDGATTDAAPPGPRALDMGAKATEHGLPTPASTTLKSIVFTSHDQQRDLTYSLQSSSPLVQVSPTVMGPAYADDCKATGASLPTEYGLLTNAGTTALYIYLTAYVSASAGGPQPQSQETRVFAFDALAPAAASAATCITPLSYDNVQVLGDSFGPLPGIYTLNGKTYRESRVIALSGKHPAPVVNWHVGARSTGFWGGDWQSVHVVEQNCGLWCPISETVEGSGVLALPIRLGAGKSVLFVAQVEHADMAAITMVADSALPN